MPASISIAHRAPAPSQEEVARIAAAVERHGRATLLAPDFAERDVCRRTLADAGLGLAVAVETPASWLAALWELWGDGRQLVDAAARKLLLAEVLCRHAERAPGEGGLRESAGTVDMLARAARGYLPYALAADTAGAFTASEREVLGALRRYADLLAEHGLIEPATAAVLLARRFRDRGVPASERFVALRGTAELPVYLIDLLTPIAASGEVTFALEAEAHDLALDIERALRARGVLVARAGAPEPAALVEAGALADVYEVAGPTARGAAYVALLDELLRRDEHLPSDGVAHAAEAVVVDPRPVSAFRVLAPRLVARGAAVRAEGSSAFAETRAGEMLFVLADLIKRLEGEEPSAWWPAPELPDWMRSPFSGLGPAAARSARAFDAHLRKTRKLDAAALLAELDRLQSREQQRERERADEAGVSAHPVVLKPVIDALREARYGRALTLMRDAAAAASPASFGAEGLAAQQTELAALDAALALTERARELGLTAERAFTVLPGLRVRLAWAASPVAADTSIPLVEIVPPSTAATRTPDSASAVLLTDADATSYPLSHRTTVDELLAQKLGVAPLAASPAVRQRVTFRRALALGARAAVAYVAHDAHGEEVYPALAVSELKARRAAAGLAEVSAAAQVPTESALFSNLDPAGGTGARIDTEPRLPEHALAPELEHLLLLPERAVGGEARPRTLSASQIENYLACPYRWFVTNRVSTRRLDVGFGPIEMGNFVHDVMQRFHERLREAGLGRVTPENLAASLTEMDSAFDEMRADHARGKYTHGRYDRSRGGRPQTIKIPLVATDEIERGQIEAMRQKLREVVRYESDMLSIFTPELLEYSFDKEGVIYAGRPLGGRIDRIDTAPDAGSGERFVVIDYKNRAALGEFACPDPTMARDEGEALDPAWLPGRDEDRSPKVQTLIYATAYARLTGGSPQGAVYFGTRGPVVKGAVAAALTESEPPAFPHDAVSGYPGVKPRGSRSAKHDGTLDFSHLLSQVEHAVELELDALEQGRIAPEPARDACTHCPVAMCPRRR